jgi:hypothetical protein
MKQTCLVNAKENEKGITSQARNDRPFHMKVSKTVNFYLVIYFILASCTSSTKNENQENSKELATLNANKDIIVIDIDNANKENVLYLSDYFKNVHPVALENNEEALIGRVNKIAALNEFIIILDKSISKNLFIFDKDGKFIRKIGRIGNAPGEFVDISDFTIDSGNNIIYLLDSHSQRINWYEISSGKFINSIRIKNNYVRSYHIQYIAGKMYADAYFPKESENNFLLRTLNLTTGEQESCWMSKSIYNKGWNELYFDRSDIFISNNSPIVKFNQTFMDMVVSIAPEGVSPYLTIQSRDLLTKQELQATAGIEADKRMASLMQVNKIQGIRHYLEFGKYIYIEYKQKNSIYSVLYNTEIGKTQIAKAFIDDLVYSKDIVQTIIPKFYYADSDKVYGVLQTHEINRFLQLAKDGYLSNEISANKKLINLTRDSNPIIFFYEY